MAGQDPHTRLFHEWLEPLLGSDLSGLELRIVLWIARESFGWGRKLTALNISQIARDTMSDRANVRRAVRSLTQVYVLLCRDGKVAVNKHAWQWKIRVAPGWARRRRGAERVPPQPLSETDAAAAAALGRHFPGIDNAEELAVTWGQTFPGVAVAREIAAAKSYAVSAGRPTSGKEGAKFMHYWLAKAARGDTRPAKKGAPENGKGKIDWGGWAEAARKAGFET